MANSFSKFGKIIRYLSHLHMQQIFHNAQCKEHVTKKTDSTNYFLVFVE